MGMLTPLDLEALPVFDQTEETEWFGEVLAMHRIRDPVHKHRRYTDDLEPLFQNNMLMRRLNQGDGPEWAGGAFGNIEERSRVLEKENDHRYDLETVDPSPKGAKPEAHELGS
jgi:hypothetical protein